MVPSNNYRRLGQLLKVAIMIALVVLGYTIFRAIYNLHNTGILQIATSETQSVITISSNNTDAEVVGTGTARLRLPPGDYIVGATHNGNNVTSLVHVAKQHISKTTLNLAKPNNLPSSDDTAFINFDALINNGLSATQTTNLKQLFLAYKPSSQIISIDTTSVAPGPHDPNSDDISFSLEFRVTIDAKPFKAKASYSGFESVTLTIYNPSTGARLYTGTSPGS